MNQHDRQHNHPRLLPSSQVSHRHTWQLASRILPLVALAVGGLWWMLAMQPAVAQFPNQQNPRGHQFQPINQNFNAGAAPTIPASAMPSTDFQTPAPTKPPEENGWELPGFISKIFEGGWLMLPLGVCCLIVFSLSMERLVALRRGRVIPRPFVRRFTECVEDGQLSYEEATELCEEFDCPVAEVFRAAVRRWGRPMFEVEQAVMDAGDRVADGLRRFLRVFHAISNVAPLLGLLGTVLGMIQAFETISTQASMGRPESLASGISIALMTTAGGLLVAIPAYLAYMYFSSKSDNYLNEIDKLCQRVVDCISAEGLENASENRSSRKRRAA
jgi:biopolymer transport protein ExbB